VVLGVGLLSGLPTSLDPDMDAFVFSVFECDTFADIHRYARVSICRYIGAI